jgi:hypothetical protein
MDGRELEAYERFKEEAQIYRARCYDLEGELRVTGPALYRADQNIDRLEQRLKKVVAENKILKRRLADLTQKLRHKPKPPTPAFVKPNSTSKTGKRPGRKQGHPAALRPMPSIIDVHETVALPVDGLGKPCCPECRSQLNEVATHERYVEELIPSKVVTTCYHTTSGWCPCCRKRIESRGENQPPAADLVKPLYDLMIQRVLQSHVICTDDTVMPMQWPGKTKQARM